MCGLAVVTHHMCCLEPPSSVRSLTVDSVDETTVGLSWRRPVDSGGRWDVWFGVDCDACDEKFVLYRPRQAHFNDTSYVAVAVNITACTCHSVVFDYDRVYDLIIQKIRHFIKPLLVTARAA